MLIRIGKIETAKFLVDSSIRTGNEQASRLKKNLKLGRQEAQVRYERARISFIGKNLELRLTNIIRAFPRWENLSEFYLELAKCTLELEAVKEQLGTTDRFMRQVRKLTSMYEDKAAKCRTEKALMTTRQAYIGRLHHESKTIEAALQGLDKARKIMREYPVVRDSLFTVAITGFPNVGKTTLLSRLTGSTPEIQNYSFTTKNINIGYI
ncbi:MAG: GTPase, partial [Candidatus Woesearchaeota archaeon]